MLLSVANNKGLALYELSFAQVEATGTDRLSVTFEAIKMIDQNYLNIVFKPPKYSMGCRINTTVLLQITKAAFSILDNGLPKYPFLNQERVISAIEAKLSLDETGDFICLIMDPQLEQNMSFLEVCIPPKKQFTRLSKMIFSNTFIEGIAILQNNGSS